MHKESADYCVAVSWVLYSIREVMGFADVRNEVLETFLPSHVRHHVELGETFGSDSKPQQLVSYLSKETRQQKHSKRYLIFSGINRPQYGETHYQGFIVDRQAKAIYIADPAYLGSEPGIYKPFLAQQQVIPFFREKGYTSQFIVTTNPCQTTTDDVFCQSWTLYLVIEFFKHPDHKPIPIPPSTIRRYGILLKFYKSILTRFSNIGDELRSLYLSHISRHRSLVQGISSPGERKAKRDAFKAVDPVHVLLKQMSASDIEEC